MTWLTRGTALGLTSICSAILLTITGCALPSVEGGESTEIRGSAFQGTPSEYMQSLAECMRDRGAQVEVIVQDDGQSVISVPNRGPNTGPDMLELNGICAAEIGLPPIPTTEEQIAEAFAGLESQYVCLRDAGWPTTAPPSLQAFSDEALTGVITYNPFELVPPEQLMGARERCPRDWDKWW